MENSALNTQKLIKCFNKMLEVEPIKFSNQKLIELKLDKMSIKKSHKWVITSMYSDETFDVTNLNDMNIISQLTINDIQL